jgi:hypothetical protein
MFNDEPQTRRGANIDGLDFYRTHRGIGYISIDDKLRPFPGQLIRAMHDNIVSRAIQHWITPVSNIL